MQPTRCVAARDRGARRRLRSADGSTVMSAAKDFIETFQAALEPDACNHIVGRIRESDALQPGRVGGGVPELKHSRDLQITGRADWADIEQALNVAVYGGLLTYLRRYPQALIAPLMLQQTDGWGQPRRLDAEDFAAMDSAAIADLARTCLRPGAINLQRYVAVRAAIPTGIASCFPSRPLPQTLHREVLWTIYLNDGFDEGETEFLFQPRKIVPRTGSLLIAPTAFTHTHRGNRPQERQ